MKTKIYLSVPGLKVTAAAEARRGFSISLSCHLSVRGIFLNLVLYLFL